jgi:hypothetical protein
MNPRLLVLIVVSAIVPLSQQAYARIGETETQCRQRYGGPVKVTETEDDSNYKMDFVWHGIDITVNFKHRKSDSESYSSDDALGKMTDEQIDAALAENADGQTWIRVPDWRMAQDGYPNNEGWNRSDARFFAMTISRFVLIVDKNYNQEHPFDTRLGYRQEYIRHRQAVLLFYEGLLFVWVPLNILFGIAFGKSRGRIGAAILWALALGPVGWLIVYNGPDRRPKCLACAEVIKPGAKICPHCRSSLVVP